MVRKALLRGSPLSCVEPLSRVPWGRNSIHGRGNTFTLPYRGPGTGQGCWGLTPGSLTLKGSPDVKDGEAKTADGGFRVGTEGLALVVEMHRRLHPDTAAAWVSAVEVELCRHQSNRILRRWHTRDICSGWSS